MCSQTKKPRDVFTFGMGGMTVFSGFTGFPAVADDSFSKKCDEPESANKRQEPTRWSLRRRRKAA